MIDKSTSARIANKYYNDIHRFCASKLNDSDAKDVTQEVFLLFQEKCPYLDDVNISAWLLSVATKKIHETYRKNKKEINLKERLEIFDDMVTEIGEICQVTEDEILKAKDEVFSKLSEKEIRLFEMIYTQRRKHADIAAELETTEKAISMKAYRLNKKIKKLAAETIVHISSILLYILFFKNF